MKKLLLLLLLFATRIAAQEPDMAKRTVIVFLSSEVIAGENFNKDAMVNWVKEVQAAMANLMKTEKSNSVVKIIASWTKDRKCKYQVSVCPENNSLIEQVNNALQPINSPVANFASFDLQLSFKFNEGCNSPEIFSPEINSAAEKMKKDLGSQTLLQRKETIRNWALQEVIPILAHFTKNVDAQFPGVQATGKMLEQKSFLNQQAAAITEKDPLYWRGLMEMNKGNLIIPLSKVLMHVANDEFDLARRYLGMLFRFADKESLASHYLLDLNRNLDLFYQSHDSLVREGIRLHDDGKYAEAIKQYNTILAAYPNSAWARYELYFSSTYLEKGNKAKDQSAQVWAKHQPAVYAADPLYPMGGGASNGREAFLLFRHLQVKELFRESSKLKEDLFTYADIALDLSAYSFAAHLYWYLMIVFPEEKYKGQSLLVWYLYSLQKLGVTEPQKFFKEDYTAVLNGLDKTREDAMKNDPMYKSFKE